MSEHSNVESPVAMVAAPMSRWKRLLVLAILYFAPILASWPFVAVLRYQESRVLDGNDILQQQIKRLEAKIQEVHSLDTDRDSLLARRAIVTQLLDEQGGSGILLASLGRLPPTVQLTAITMDSDKISLAGRTIDPVSVSDSLLILRGAGLTNVVVPERRLERPDSAIETFQIEANVDLKQLAAAAQPVAADTPADTEGADADFWEPTEPTPLPVDQL